MESKTIHDLLEKYWKGETSLLEEKELTTYFSQPNIAPELKKYQPFFVYAQQEKDVALQEDFEERLFATIDTLEASVAPPSIAKTRTLRTWIASAAAMFMLCVASYFLYQNYNQTEQKKGATVIILDDATDAEAAYDKVKAALMLVSSKMNNGKSKAVNGLEKLNAIDKIRISNTQTE